MKNLFKKETETYVMQTTKEEVYQQETFCKIVVKDEAGAMKQFDDRGEVLERLYEMARNGRFKEFVYKTFDPEKYEFEFDISALGRDRIAEVKITKKHRFSRKRTRC